jgi:hypothetical protein
MRHHPILNLVLLPVLMTSPAEAQPLATPPGGPYKIAFWYEADRPTTLKYQVYDLSKGEYDEKAVDRWLRTILDRYPNHGAYVRDIQTRGEPGATEQERLASAIGREKRRWADLQRQASRPVPWLIETSATVYQKPRTETPSRTSFDRPAPGSPGIIYRPPTSPFPYPYRSGPR